MCPDPLDCIPQEAVQNDKVENIMISVGTQRRAVLEAIAFGAFLRCVEIGCVIQQ